MIETMTAMTTATMAIVRAFMGRLPGLQQRSRRPYSVSLQHKFIAAVESISGRDVLAFISNHHVGPDMEIELFMLEPKLHETVAAIDG
jgi:hypothetical protein